MHIILCAINFFSALSKHSESHFEKLMSYIVILLPRRWVSQTSFIDRADLH